MASVFLPTYSFWINGNDWYGSLGQARFYIQPVAEEDAPPDRLTVQFWRGPLTLELSDVLDTQTFPLGQEGEGLSDLAAWLETQAAHLNGSSDPA